MLESLLAAAIADPKPKQFAPVHAAIATMSPLEQASALAELGTQLAHPSVPYVDGVRALIDRFLNDDIDLAPLVEPLCACLGRDDTEAITKRLVKTLVFSLPRFATWRPLSEAARTTLARVRSDDGRAGLVLAFDAALAGDWASWRAEVERLDPEDVIDGLDLAHERGVELRPIVDWLADHPEPAADLLAELGDDTAKRARRVELLCATNDPVRQSEARRSVAAPLDPELEPALLAAIETRGLEAIYGVTALARGGYPLSPAAALAMRARLSDPAVAEAAAMALLSLRAPCTPELVDILARSSRPAAVLLGAKAALDGGADVAPLLPFAIGQLVDRREGSYARAFALIAALAERGVDCASARPVLVELAAAEVDLGPAAALIA